MVTLIFEGVDNLGKGTIINKLISEYKDTRDITLMHSTGPHPNEGEDPFSFQEKSFLAKADKVAKIAELERNYRDTEPKHIVILDRAWFGEYVYGQIYRNASADKIIKMIHACNSKIDEPNNTTVVIHPTASAMFAYCNDDDKSLYSHLEGPKIEHIQIELDMFSECLEKTAYHDDIRVIDICVENEEPGCHTRKFRDIETIYNELKEKLEDLGVEL